MRVLRILLLVMTASVLFLITYGAITEQIRDTDVRFAGVVACAFILNLIYLLFSKPSGASARIRQLFSLWLDAKETELT
jgi:cytochrome c oxidase assembly factor CtaG